MNVKITSLGTLLSLVALTTLVCLLFPVSSNAQTHGANRADKNVIRKRIDAIINERLGELDRLFPPSNPSPGSPVYTRIPPSPEAIREIKTFGDDGVPILSYHLSSKNERERSYAVELMGLLGGRRVVVPLRNVVNHDASPNVRILALRWLAQQLPSNLAMQIIHEVAKSNTDERVRKAAKNVLETGTVYGVPEFSVPFRKESPK